MKLTVFFLIVSLYVSANGVAQKVTLNLKDAPFIKALQEIGKQTNFAFLYNEKTISQAKPVTINVKDAEVSEVLILVFKDQPLKYTITGQSIRVVSETSISESEDQPAPLIDIKGKVVNEKGEPVVGASVQVKGDKTKGATTDENGYFILKGIDENATLIITGTDIEILQVKLNGRTDLGAITTKIREIVGDEVVINTGYQKLRPNEVTGAVVQIDKELINRSVSTDILSRLRGISSGLLMFGSGGTDDFPNANSILIRGYSTILAEKRPLIILDDFPFAGDISNINPNDVESITVLKDAAASSIWGVLAGNGVIVISSKNGKYNQRERVSFNSNIVLSQKPDLYYSPVLGSSDYIDAEIFLFSKGFYNNQINGISRPALTPVIGVLLKRKNGLITAADSASQIDFYRQYDVRDDLLNYYYRRSMKSQYAISITGGGRNQQYYASLGYDYNLNNTIKDQYSRLTIDATNTYSLLKRRLEISTGIWLAQTITKSGSSSYNNLALLYPYERLADESGKPLPVALRRQEYIDTAGAGRLLDWSYYPLDDIANSDNKVSTLNYRLNVSMKYRIIPALEVSIKGLTEKGQATTRNMYNSSSYYTRDYINSFSSINWQTGVVSRAVPLGSILDHRSSIYTSQNIRGQINYDRNVNQNLKLAAIAGAEVRNVVIRTNTFRYYGYDEEIGASLPVDFVNTYKNYITGSPSRILSNQFFNEFNNRNTSFFANAAVTLKNRYTISGSLRRDGSNIFGVNINNKWKPLWSTGIRWNIDKEGFYDVKWLPDLKIRATYGYQGNVDNSVAALLTISTVNSLNPWNSFYSIINNPPNPDLRWEKVRQVNIGIDFGFRNETISGSIDYYRKNGIDLLGNQELPPSSGFASTKANSADIKGEGIDLVVDGKIIVNNNFNWNVTFLFSYAKDRVSAYKLKQSTIKSYVEGNINPVVGRPRYSIYSYRWAGLDPATGDPQGYLDGQVSKNYASLMASSNLENMVYNGPAVPPYFGSLMSTFRWRELAVSFNIVYKVGYYFRRPSIDYSGFFSGSNKGHKDYELQWRKPGDEQFTNVPSLIYPSNSNRDLFYGYSEILVEKGDHIRLQDFRISYDLNRKALPSASFQNIRLYMILSNFHLIWKANKSGIDPDYVANNYTSGLPRKTLSIGIKTDF